VVLLNICNIWTFKYASVAFFSVHKWAVQLKEDSAEHKAEK
jgi:hypothetical protein